MLGAWRRKPVCHTGAMRQAHFESQKLWEYIAARSGTLCVSVQAIMHG